MIKPAAKTARGARAAATVPAEPAADVASILRLTRALIRAPSRAGEDSYDAVLDVMRGWFDANGLRYTLLKDKSGTAVGMLGEFGGAARARRAPRVLLNATLDTAPFGDRANWRFPPTSARVQEGWLYGRGAADSKCGAALFAHLARWHARNPGAGRLDVLFDLDEHSGRFSGIKRYVATRRHGALPAIAMLGYPDNERIVIGGRGFARARLVVGGVAAHSGSSSRRGINAIERATRLVEMLCAWQPPARAGADFPLAPSLTVTGMHGGEGFSMVPDRCELAVDVRLTPSFTAHRAQRELAKLIAHFDQGRGAAAVTTVAWLPDTWPAYRLKEGSAVVRALRTAAGVHFGRDIPTAVAGPSNIGNYLATLGVATVAGFGVTARGVHGADECIEIDSIGRVWRTYRDALAELLRPES